ncbi:MAG: YbaN family protein [Pseudomonadota bacterium]
MRPVWILLGCISLVVGLIGIVVPLLPTTVFLLIAAFCFARGSERLHSWLLDHPKLGPPIEEWNRHGAISKNAKRLAAISMLATLGISWVLGAAGWIIAVQAVVLAAVATFLLTRPLPPE